MNNELEIRLAVCAGALARLAARNDDARRRLPTAEDDDGWMGTFGSPFAVDVNKLLCSKAIRRLDGKAQVMVLPSNCHTRDRLSHSFEVASIATTAGRILGLNEALCQAAALAHDTGHTPLGHGGERLISEFAGREFRHEVFGVVVAQKIERRGAGLNLTYQTLDAVLNHSRGSGDLRRSSLTAEGDLVMYADKMAYIFADFNDIFTRGVQTGSPLKLDDFSGLAEEVAWFGASHRERTFTCVAGLCLESAERGEISFRHSETAARFDRLKKRMYEVYHRTNRQETEDAARRVIEHLAETGPGVDPAVIFALLVDDDVRLLSKILDSCGMLQPADLACLSVSDVLPHICGHTIDFADPDMGW
jgi:dGTPase